MDTPHPLVFMSDNLAPILPCSRFRGTPLVLTPRELLILTKPTSLVRILENSRLYYCQRFCTIFTCARMVGLSLEEKQFIQGGIAQDLHFDG